MGTSDEDGREARRRAVRQALGALSALVPVGVAAVDPDGGSWYHNQRWEDVTGARGVRFRGRPWYEAAHPDDVEVLAGRWHRRLGQRGSLGQFRVLSAAGVERRCRGESMAMVGVDGEVDGYLIVVADAGDQDSRALSAVQGIDAMLDRSQDIITVLNPDGSWRWSSGGALRLVGHLAEFDPDAGLVTLFHPDDQEAAQKSLARALAGDIGPDERFEYRIRAQDGSWRSMEAIIDNLLDDPAVRGVVVHARDVTERRQTLADLEESNRRLAEMDATRSEFLAAVSHEMRTPLTSIVSYAQLLRQKLGPQVPPDEAECLEAIQRNADRLMRLASDLVVLNSLETGTLPLHLTSVDMGAVIRQAAHTISPVATGKGVQLQVEVAGRAPLHGDGERLGQLVDNLLSNAVKFTPALGRVTVRGAPCAEGWTVEVTDSGMGIPDDEVDHLFTRFYRGSNVRAQGLPGTGLGLSIVQAIADLHRGTIVVRSQPGAGTSFEVTLRGAPAEAGAGS